MSTERVRKIAEQILSAFREGRLPAALAHVFIHQHQSFPCYRWSRRNRLIVALHGHSDARGFRQWLAVDRHVRKGERAFDILAPRLRRRPERDTDLDGEEATALIGWTAVPVFGYHQTHGAPIEAHEQAARFIEALPVLDVARAWNIEVQAAMMPGKYGSYSPGPDNPRIRLADRNLSTWSHELIHAADDRLGYLRKKDQDKLAKETVAEFGGTVLLECLGETVLSDRGGAYEYIEHFAREHKRSAVDVCLQLMDRACECVELILRTAGLLPDSVAGPEHPTA